MKKMQNRVAAIVLAGVLGCFGAVAIASAQDQDVATGGGWITGTPTGDSANFGFVGGITNSTLFGHLNYVDQASDIHVRSTAIVSYTVVDADTREIVYEVLVDGVTATARIVVTDVSEPGWDDEFSISLSTGYSASGTLDGDHPGGGNIQVHALDGN